ncbi:MAG: type IV pilus twitching motility protein PilT [Chloroflexi bacterium]|nr:type IV pilus twitching motility protein PilT [Chloroflexota bacterium]
MDIIALLQLAQSNRASDLHLCAGVPPMFRIDGALQRLEGMPALSPEEVNTALGQLTTEEQRRDFNRELELDFAYEVQDCFRVRCNAAVQRKSISLALRLISNTVPGFEELHLPEVCRELALKPRGLLIVSGPTGSGKSTTLAAMIDYLNRHESRRVVTIEDPIEYTHTSDRCAIIQRELGEDTISFSHALKHVLRQDPDVILVGEMRDPETAAAALTISETGHLLMTTGHAPSASQAVERIIDLFPPHERYLAQARLASLVIGILCQTLVPKADGKGRLPAVEVMLGNPAVKNLIREGKIHQLPNTIRTYASDGMKLLDQALADLYTKGMISGETMLSRCNDRHEVESLCPGVMGRTNAAHVIPFDITRWDRSNELAAEVLPGDASS